MTRFETHVGERAAVVSLVDRFAQLRGTRGAMPVPIPPLHFHLVAREVQNAMIPFEAPLALRAQGGPSGAFVFADEARSGAGPFTRVEPGRYRLRIDSDFYERLEADVDWPPPSDILFALRPGFAYPFPDLTLPAARVTLLRGLVVRDASGTPVEGALVEIIDPPNLGELTSARTDANGAWVLAFRHANANPIDATVRITIPGEAALDLAQVPILPGSDNSLGYTALRGSVLSIGGDPIRSAEISVDLVPNAVVRTDRHGRWAFYFGLDQQGAAAQVTALAPNGQSDSKNVQLIHRKTVMVETFRLAMN